MTLSPKHRKVVDAYMKGATKKQAMLDAGFSPSTARTRPNDVFGRPEVISEIQRRQSLASHRSDVTLDWIVQRLKAIADANIGDMLDIYSDGSAKINFNKLTPELRIALSKFDADSYAEGRGRNAQEIKKLKVGFSDKVRALELLIRHLGLSKERNTLEVSGEVSMVEALQRGRSRAGISSGGGSEDD